MKVNFDSVLVDLDGEPIVERGEEIMLKKVCINALLNPEQEEGAVKAEKYVLALDINKGGERELKSEDIVLIKKCVGKAFGPIIVGQVFDLLEGKE